jgi:hypothetical protein
MVSKFKIIIFFFLLLPKIYAQTNISLGSTISENFDGLGISSAATLPSNWVCEKLSTTRTISNFTSITGIATDYANANGNSMSSSAGNGIYNFGGSSSSDRSIGGLSSSAASKSVNFVWSIKNNGSSTINDFTISFDAERYRKGSNTSGFSIRFYYSTNGTTWTELTSAIASFTANANNNGSTTTPIEVINIKNKLLPQSLSYNNTLYLCWSYSVTSNTTTSSAQALGIDNIKISANNNWLGTTNNNWSTASNWSAGHIPNSTESISISSGSPILDVDYEIPTSYSLTLSGTGTLTINPGKKLTVTGNADFGGNSVIVASDASGSGAIVLNGGTLSNASNVTLQQWMTAQRAWRVLSNPFNSTLTPSTISSSNGSNSGSSAISVNQNGANDVVQYNSGNDQWSLSNSISANTCYAFFYKGLLGDFNGTPSINNYVAGGGPSATVYSVNGTLNYSDVNFTPTSATPNFTLIGNPFAAPINSQALTENSSLPYYYYSANSGSTDIKVKSGAWLAASTNSSTSTTIPMMGAIAYQATSTGTFTISKNSINTAGTLNTSLFKTTSGIKNLEINLVRNSNLHDRLIIREDDAAISNSIDAMDLNKMENPISNIYSITPNNQHLAVNTEYQFTQAIPLGINAPIGQYEFKVGANSFSNTDMVLIDHYLNQQQVLHNGATYNFEITADSNTKGEHRFEIAKQAWATNISTSTTMEGLQILNNVVVDQITLFAAPQKQAMHYMLLDINAALIDKGNLIPGENHISTQTLAQGLYLLHVTNENAHIVYKIIKQ